MAESGNLGHVVRALAHEMISGARIVPSNARANRSQISLGGAVTINLLAAMHLPIG
jgi:hypothetical protein